MRDRYGLIVAVLVIAGLQLSACQRQAGKEKAEPAAKVERIAGTELSRVTLSERAIQRLGLQTDQVREAKLTRKRTVGGEVIVLPAAQAADRGRVLVRVRLAEGDLRNVVRGQPARVLLRDRDDDDGLAAEAADDVEDEDEGEDKGKDKDEEREKGKSAVGDRTQAKAARLYYVVARPEHGLVPGQRVRVKLPLAGSRTKGKVVPYSALIYDKYGQTWVYTSPNPRTFVRHKVEVDYIQGNIAVLKDGPPAGTVIASVGAAELYGADAGIGK
jgi:hypothetical protein